MRSRHLGSTGTTMDKAALGAAIASAAFGVAAIALKLVANRRPPSTGLAGSARRRAKMIERHKAGGMTLEVYADAKMPIEMRVGIIQDYVGKSLQNPEIVGLAQAIVGQGARRVKVGKYHFDVRGAACGNDEKCKVDAVGAWTKANVRYTGDVGPVRMGRNGPTEGIDLFQAATRTIEMGGEDCDGHTGVNAPLLMAVGVTAGHRVTAPRAGEEWSHIYTVANVGGRPLAVDTTLPGTYATGREAHHGRQADFSGV